MSDMVDVIVIGGGVVGCSIARELARYDLKIRVLEKEPDVAFGTSGRNSGVVHSGINYKPGTYRADLDVRGNAMTQAFNQHMSSRAEIANPRGCT